MVKVVTTGVSKANGIKIKEFKGIVPAGKEFEVSEERYKELAGNNAFHLVFVTRVEEPKAEKPLEADPIEEACEECAIPVDEPIEVKVEAPKKKKTTKKK